MGGAGLYRATAAVVATIVQTTTASASTGVVVFTIERALVVSSCSCAAPAGFACVATEHPGEEARAAWTKAKALERRREFRTFVRACAAPRARAPRPQHRPRTSALAAWRVRALGRLPGQRTASG